MNPLHPHPQSFWDLDHPITARMDWRGWLGIALMALLAALPLLAAVLRPEPPAAKAVRRDLVRSQQEVNQAYLELAAAHAKAENHVQRSAIPAITPEARRGHPLPR